MSGIGNMGSLLAKMTAETSGEMKFTSSQVDAVIEILIPRMITGMPGMPKGMTCSIERDDKGWDIRVDRPE